jgi:MOSC domain-containing protein YiiM
MGSVLALALRGPGTAAPTPVDAAHALAGLGLEGDRHLDARSPRQVLLASQEVYEELGLAPLTLRENLLLDLATCALPSGSLLRIGTEAILRVSFQCEACGSLERLHPGLVRAIGQRRGVLARVHAGGVIRGGDPVQVLAGLAPALSEDWRERVVQVLAAMPPGLVVEYAELARLAGIQSSYCRAFPRLLAARGLGHKALPARASAGLARWDGAGLYDCITGDSSPGGAC